MNDWHSWAAVAAFVSTYVLIVTERIHRTAVALAGGHVWLRYFVLA